MTSSFSKDRDRPNGDDVGRAWERIAFENEAEYGVQHPEELLSAITEELGEIEQAYLEATHEDAWTERVEDEINDLGPLLLQLVESLRTHPRAFEGLPTADDAGGDER
jgi:NTP pyrophosphatase (non-canonical NTP hydrolase)